MFVHCETLLILCFLGLERHYIAPIPIIFPDEVDLSTLSLLRNLWLTVRVPPRTDKHASSQAWQPARTQTKLVLIFKVLEKTQHILLTRVTGSQNGSRKAIFFIFVPLFRSTTIVATDIRCDHIYHCLAKFSPVISIEIHAIRFASYQRKCSLMFKLIMHIWRVHQQKWLKVILCIIYWYTTMDNRYFETYIEAHIFHEPGYRNIANVTYNY